MQGSCNKGDMCTFLHGSKCSRCDRNVLHPQDAKQRATHEAECSQAEKVRESKKASSVECGICMENIKQFGILIGCDHSFCLLCIKKWRVSSQAQKRSCPMCRQLSDYVVPSDSWFTSAEQKAGIIANYKTACSRIRCKHFEETKDCPFGEVRAVGVIFCAAGFR